MQLYVLLDLLVEVEDEVVVDHRVFEGAQALRQFLAQDRLARDLLPNPFPIMLILFQLKQHIVDLLLQMIVISLCIDLLASFVLHHSLELVKFLTHLVANFRDIAP